MTLWFRVAPLSPPEAGDRWWIVPARYQGAGRADNPRHYRALYLSREPQAAIAEAFAELPTWTSQMFTPPSSGGALGLAGIEVPDEVSLVDLDNAATLHRLGLRPTDVVRRNRDRTQEVSLRLFLEERWDGLAWWSYWRPEWQMLVLWAPVQDPEPFSGVARLAHAEPLHLEHPAVRLAADVMRRPVQARLDTVSR